MDFYKPEAFDTFLRIIGFSFLISSIIYGTGYYALTMAYDVSLKNPLLDLSNS